MKYLLFLIVFISLYNTDVYFYPEGAPLERCGSMFPGHNVDPLKEAPPYVITLTPLHRAQSESGAAKKYYVNIHGTDETVHFKGFLLEARGRWDGESIGTWETDVKRTKTLDCFNKPHSALTHHYDDNAERLKSSGFTNVTFVWTAPQSKKLNRVKFIATIVRKFDQIYMNVTREVKIKEF